MPSSKEDEEEFIIGRMDGSINSSDNLAVCDIDEKNERKPSIVRLRKQSFSRENGIADFATSWTPVGGAAIATGRLGCLREVYRPAGGTGKPYEPNIFCSWVAEYPRHAMATTLLSWLFFVVLTLVLVAVGVDVFPLVFDDVPLHLIDDDTYLRYLGWKQAPQNVNYKRNTRVGERSLSGTGVYLLYNMKSNQNIFTQQVLQSIEIAERSIIATPEYDNWCKLFADNETISCEPPLSVISLFNGVAKRQYADVSEGIDIDENYENINMTISKWFDVHPDLVESLVGKDFSINSNGYHTSICRSVFSFGLPAPGYTDPDFEREEQIKLIDSWVADSMFSLLSKIEVPQCRTLYMNRGVLSKATTDQVKYDLALAVGSLTFVFLFMWKQTSSLLVTGTGIGGVLIAFFVANLFYRFVLGYKFFGIFHVLSVFIILGIGADDVFVFYDAWLQAGLQRIEIRDSSSKRLSFAYRRSITAILITSATTAFSFISASATPLLAMHTFGLYSALLVVFNFIIVCTLLPAAVLVWENYYRYIPVCCLRYHHEKSQKSVVDPFAIVSTEALPSQGLVERAFKNYWAPAVTHKKGKFVIIGCFAVLVIVFLIGAVQLEVDKEATKIWKPGTNWQDFSEFNSKKMKQSKESARVQVIIIWGVQNQDRSNCGGATDYKCDGVINWDDSFDLNPKPAQLEMLQLCNEIRSLASNPQAVSNLALHLNRKGEVQLSCFIEYINTTLYNDGFPVSQDSFNTYMPELLMRLPYNQSSYYRWFELGLAVISGLVAPQEVVVPLTNTGFMNEYSGYLGAVDEEKYGAQLKYAAITVDTTLLYPVSFQSGLPVNDNWEAYLEEKRRNIAPSLNRMFHIGKKVNGIPDPFVDNSFHWMKVQEVLVKTAFTGILLGLLLALVVLTLASSNIIVGVAATATIGCIVVMVLGMVYYAGWKIGVLESLNLTLVVGLSVDYVVHLAHAYVEAPPTNRTEKVHFALVNVGVSILSGALTSLGSSMFMLFAEIVFFFQFGLFMFSTIAFSCCFALILFPAIMSTIGPEGPHDNLYASFSYNKIRIWIFHKLKSKGRNGITEECEICDGDGFTFTPHENIQAMTSMIQYRKNILASALAAGVINKEEFIYTCERLKRRARRGSVFLRKPVNPLQGKHNHDHRPADEE